MFFRQPSILEDQLSDFFHILLIEQRVHRDDRDFLLLHGNAGDQKIRLSKDIRCDVVFSICAQDHLLLKCLLQLGDHQPGNADAAGTDHAYMHFSDRFLASFQAEYRRPKMHGQKSRFFFRHHASCLFLQDCRNILAFPVNLRITFPDFLKHGILDTHPVHQPDQGRLQMCQKPLYKFVVLFEQAGLYRIIGIDHLIDKLMQLLIFYLQARRRIPLDLLMLGAFDMETDIRNLHFRDPDQKLLFQLRHNFLRKTVILVLFYFLHPAVSRLDDLIFQNTVYGDRNMEYKSYIGIFRQVLHPKMVRAFDTIHDPSQSLVVQHLPDLAFVQKLISVRLLLLHLIGVP